MRAPYQVLIFPYIINYGCWQGLAGDGEDDETPNESAKREAFVETGIVGDYPYIKLDSMSSLPVERM